MGQPSRHDHNHNHGRVSTAPDRVALAVEAAVADTTNSFIDVHEAAPAADPMGPLGGVPIAVKDLIDHRGHITTAGSAFYRHAATATAPALRRLEKAGAVVVGRTNLHEFAFGFSSENPWFGPVKNPWDPALSTGGSSGGSAAAVAAGIVPIALGTDTGGSVRVPAALCGVTGLKVTHGLIPLDGVFPLVPSLDTVGAIASDLDSLELATRTMAAERWPSSGTGEDPIRLVVPGKWVDTAPLSTEVHTAFHRFLEDSEGAGLEVEHEELPLLAPSPHQSAIIGTEVAPIHGKWRQEGRPYGDDVAERIDAALEISGDMAALEEARRWRAALTEAATSATEAGRLIVTPTVGSIDKRIGEDHISGDHYRTVLSWFTAPVNATGLPALSIPLSGSGRRPALQIIGFRNSEPALLAVARQLEKLGLVGMNRWSSA